MFRVTRTTPSFIPLQQGSPSFKLRLSEFLTGGALLQINRATGNITGLPPSRPIAYANYYRVTLPPIPPFPHSRASEGKRGFIPFRGQASNRDFSIASTNLQDFYLSINGYWVDTELNTLSVIANKGLQFIKINFSYVNNNSIILPENFTVEEVFLEGSSISFSQQGTQLVTSASPGATINVVANLNIDDLTPTTEVILFFEDRFTIISSAEWEGKVYYPAENSLNPSHNELLFGNCYVWLFK